MIDVEYFNKQYMQAMLGRLELMAQEINKYPFIESAIVQGEGVQIKFNREITVEDKLSLDLYLKGGALKISDSKDNEEGYLKVEPIGEF